MEFLLQYGRSWDGGAQERDAARSIITDVFEDAQVQVQCTVSRSHSIPSHSIPSHAHLSLQNNSVVSISVAKNGQMEEIVSVPQRDLYAKYRWPARPKIEAALRKLQN